MEELYLIVKLAAALTLALLLGYCICWSRCHDAWQQNRVHYNGFLRRSFAKDLREAVTNCETAAKELVNDANVEPGYRVEEITEALFRADCYRDVIRWLEEGGSLEGTQW